MRRCIARVSLLFEIDPEQPVLVVPDVHQDLGFLERAVARARAEGAALIFLGDHVDAVDARWSDPAAMAAAARALPELAETHAPGCVFLAGNHDVLALQAARHRAALLIQGDEEQVAKLDAAMPAAAAYANLLGAWPQNFLRGWRLVAEVHGFLLSHAGVARRFWPWEAAPDKAGQMRALLREADAAWARWLFKNEDGPFFEVGPGRGGRNAPVGGPLWMDWDHEFVDDLPLPQVVGHTRGRAARRKDRSWCIDASQSCVALIDQDRGLRVVKL